MESEDPDDLDLVHFEVEIKNVIPNPDYSYFDKENYYPLVTVKRMFVCLDFDLEGEPLNGINQNMIRNTFNFPRTINLFNMFGLGFLYGASDEPVSSDLIDVW